VFVVRIAENEQFIVPDCWPVTGYCVTAVEGPIPSVRQFALRTMLGTALGDARLGGGPELTEDYSSSWGSGEPVGTAPVEPWSMLKFMITRGWQLVRSGCGLHFGMS
jgi:hypothetical protein